jgi:hypothetical protein
MKSKIRRRYKHIDFKFSDWVHLGNIGECPKCSLTLVAIIETEFTVFFHHSRTICCVVEKC